jgi:hypothetical protein
MRNGRYKEFTLRVFVSLMFHEESTQLVLFRFRPDCSRNFLVSRFRVVSIYDFCRIAGGLPEEELHVRLPVFLGDFGETTDYEDRELLELLKQKSIFRCSTNLISGRALCPRLNWHRAKLTPTLRDFTSGLFLVALVRHVILSFPLQCRRSISARVSGLYRVSRLPRSFFTALSSL